MVDDRANGYEEYAEIFIRSRNQQIGPSVVREWAQQLPQGAEVLELGCGHGVISSVLIETGLKLFAVDASPTLLHAFRERFPAVQTDCAPVGESTFFNRRFDAVLAWGLLFLMEEEAQLRVLSKVAGILQPDGRFLFTAVAERHEWIDVMTKRPSRSLGQDEYERQLRNLGFEILPGRKDEGGNYYYDAIKR